MTSDYSIAWLVVGVAALLAAVALFFLLGRGRSSLVRWLVIVGIPVTMVVPSPVPGYPDVLAPAFVVAIFEAFLQIDGKPGVSLRILAICVVSALLITGLIYYLLVTRRRSAVAARPTQD